MPYQILKKGNEYILKSPTKQYKHKSLAKAKSQKRLLEEKEAKVVQKVSQKQVVNVIVNQPRRRRTGQAKKQTVPQQQTVIQMRPVVPTNPMEAYYAQARPQPRASLTADESRIKMIEEDIKKLREPFMEQMKQNHLERMSAISKRDSDLLSRELFQRQMAVERQQEQLMKIKEEPPLVEYDLTKPIFQDTPTGGGIPSRERSVDSDATIPMPFPEASVGRDRAELQRMTVLQLRQILKDRGQTIGKKNKAELIDAILGGNP